LVTSTALWNPHPFVGESSQREIPELEKYPTLQHNGGVNDAATAKSPHVLVIMPNWLGDGVMATPLLRALANLPSRPRITVLCRPLVEPVVTGMPYVHEVLRYQRRENRVDIRATSRMLAERQFDAAVILPNNWRSALIAWRAGIPVRVGYGRDGRRLLLTHHLQAELRTDEEIAIELQRERYRRRVAAGGAAATDGGTVPANPGRLVRAMRRWHNYQPVSTIEYYLKLLNILPAAFTGGRPESAVIGGLGPPSTDVNGLPHERQMELFCSKEERESADDLLRGDGIGNPYAMIFPGANFGASKCWPPERFAELARWLAGGGAGRPWWVMLGGAAGEAPVLEEIARRGAGEGSGRIINLAAKSPPTSLGTVKALTAGADLVLCNDTGPRHFAAAFRRPLVTLFGPTDPRWAQTYDPCEQIVSVAVGCGPCQLKVCPIDHRCMREITVEMVQRAVEKAIEVRRV
jgi:heptosyltransferase-2